MTRNTIRGEINLRSKVCEEVSLSTRKLARSLPMHRQLLVSVAFGIACVAQTANATDLDCLRVQRDLELSKLAISAASLTPPEMRTARDANLVVLPTNGYLVGSKANEKMPPTDLDLLSGKNLPGDDADIIEGITGLLDNGARRDWVYFEYVALRSYNPYTVVAWRKWGSNNCVAVNVVSEMPSGEARLQPFSLVGDREAEFAPCNNPFVFVGIDDGAPILVLARLSAAVKSGESSDVVIGVYSIFSDIEELPFPPEMTSKGAACSYKATVEEKSGWYELTKFKSGS